MHKRTVNRKPAPKVIGPAGVGGLPRTAVKPAPLQEVPPRVREVLRSPGRPIDAGPRSFMERRFDHDFSGVRVHADEEAAKSARAINASAFTVGQDLVFGRGQYAPGSPAGKPM